MENSFATKYWKDFEILSLEYIREQYKDTTAKCIHTSYINDGGYDGRLSLTLTKSNAPFIHEVISLIEAKLRTNSNINIHDFAASIIAAYNFAANILYVISNTNFTEETIKITRTFSRKVNLQIVLIDGISLLNWLEKKTFNNMSNQFYKDLIDSIKKNNNQIKRNLNSPKMDTLSESIPSFFSETIYVKPEKIFGIRTRSIKKETINILEKIELNRRVIILSGASGTGKSILVSNIGYELQQKNYMFSIFDGDNEDGISVRNVYIWVLKALWGIDPIILYTGENISEFIDLICFTTKTPVDENIKKTIKNIFDISKDLYISKSDLYTAYLLRYLDQILENKCGKNRSILAFKNLHYLDQHILEFIISLIRCLIKNNVGIIIELSPLESVHIHDKEWKKYYDAILNFKQYGYLYELKDFEKEDAIDYLSENLPGLTFKYFEYILSHIGLKPIFLKYAIDWLKLNKVVVSESSGQYYAVAKPDDFFNGITPDQNIRIIEDIIQYYQRNIEIYEDDIIILFEAIVLMDGTLKYPLIKRICHCDNLAALIQLLLNTGLFVQNGNHINISHELVLIALKNVSLSFYQYTVAEMLYENIDILEDESLIRLKKVDLLEVLGNWDVLYKNAQQVGIDYMMDGQYKKSIKYFSICRKYYEKLKYRNHANLLEILYNELFAYHKIGMGARQKVLFSNYQSHMQIERLNTKKDLSASLCAMEKMYEARLSGSQKQYSEACEMLKYAKQNFDKIPEELYVEICFVFTLIEKKYISLNSAVNFLKDQKRILPESVELDIHYQSHEAAKYLNTDPSKALGFYQKIIQYVGVSKRNNKSIGHAYVDILTCYILSENWNLFESKYSEALEYVQTNAQYAEEGRIYNLDGLYYWLKSDFKTSEYYFRNSQFYLGLVHNRNTDIFVKINFIGLLIEMKKYKEATLELEIAYTLLKKTYRILFQQIENTKDYKHYREYAALLVLIKYAMQLGALHIIQDLINEIPIKELSFHVKQIEKGIYPEEVFSNTCIVHENIVTLTR